MKMKKRFTLSLTALIATAFLFVVTSFAWFVISQTNWIEPIDQNVYGIVYEINGEFKQDIEITPEMELLNSAITISNHSTNDLYLRIKISYTKIDRGYDSQSETFTYNNLGIVDYTDSVDDHVKVIMNENLFYETDFWYYDGLISNDGTPYILVTSLMYDGLKASNEYSSESITVSITFEVKDSIDEAWAPLTTMTTTG
jgi:hypothetical protein